MEDVSWLNFFQAVLFFDSTAEPFIFDNPRISDPLGLTVANILVQYDDEYDNDNEDREYEDIKMMKVNMMTNDEFDNDESTCDG